MDENLTPEEQQAFSNILAVINDDAPEQQAEPETVEEEAPVEQQAESIVEAQPQTAQAPMPQAVDVQKELFERLIANQEALAQQNKLLQEQVTREPQRELSEEERGIQKLREMAGVDKLEQENAMLKQQIQEIMAMKQEMEAKKQQEMEYQQHLKQVQAELQTVKQEIPTFDEKAVAEYIMKQPESYRPMLDTPQGWRMVDGILKSMAQPTEKPDNIITSKTTQPAKPDLKGMNEHDQNLARTENILRQLGM